MVSLPSLLALSGRGGWVPSRRHVRSRRPTAHAARPEGSPDGEGPTAREERSGRVCAPRSDEMRRDGGRDETADETSTSTPTATRRSLDNAWEKKRDAAAAAVSSSPPRAPRSLSPAATAAIAGLECQPAGAALRELPVGEAVPRDARAALPLWLLGGRAHQGVSERDASHVTDDGCSSRREQRDGGGLVVWSRRRDRTSRTTETSPQPPL